MAEFLTFTQRPDGSVVANGLTTSSDGTSFAVDGTVSPAPASVAKIPRLNLSYIDSLSPDLEQALFPNGRDSQTVGGPSKLGQRFVIHLLTIRGSIKHRPAVGCTFLSQLQTGPAKNEGDIFSAFALAMIGVRTSMQAEESPSDPDDERFKIAIPKLLTLKQGVLALTVEIISLAGKSTPLVLPIIFRT